MVDVLALAVLAGAIGGVVAWDRHFWTASPSPVLVQGRLPEPPPAVKPDTLPPAAESPLPRNETPAAHHDDKPAPIAEVKSAASTAPSPAGNLPAVGKIPPAASAAPAEVRNAANVKPAPPLAAKPVPVDASVQTTSPPAPQPPPSEVVAPKRPTLSADLVRRRLPARDHRDAIVEQFILYDIHQLTGAPGAQARDAFNSAGAEAIPAIIRGINRAAMLSQSCPVIVLANKLRTLLAQCGDPEMVELALDHLGAGVPPAAPYYYSLTSLQRELISLLPAGHPRRRIFDIISQAGNVPERLAVCMHSDSPEERLEAVRAVCSAGLPMGDDLLRLLDDSEPAIIQAARATLRQMARNVDYGPEPNASAEARSKAVAKWRSWWVSRADRNSVLGRIERQSDEQLRDTLTSGDANTRWAAALAIRSRGLPYYEGLIEALRDPDSSVRGEARQALVQLADGHDYGPDDTADQAAVDLSIARWEQWQKLAALVTTYSDVPGDSLLENLKHPDPLNRRAAAMAARRKGLGAPEEFITLLGDEDEEVRQEARHALVELAGGADFGPAEKTDVATAQEAAERWHKWLIWHRLAGVYGNDDPDALVMRFQDADPVKRWAAVAAARARKLAVSEQLINLLHDPSADVRQEAQEALVQLADNRDYGPSLTATAEEVERAAVAWGQWSQRNQLASRGANMTAAELSESLKSANAAVRWAAVVTARRRNVVAAEEYLVLLRDADNEIRQEARQALVKLLEGVDNGPQENASPADCEAAFNAWDAAWKQQQQRQEELAQSRLKLAESVLARNAAAGRRRLEEIVEKYPATPSARRAQQLLAKDPPPAKPGVRKTAQ
jgi:HEAT repeat protein